MHDNHYFQQFLHQYLWFFKALELAKGEFISDLNEILKPSLCYSFIVSTISSLVLGM